MSIKDHKWSDDDLSFDSLDIMEGEKSLWLAVRQPFRSDTVVNIEISDVKALAAHFELDADHKAALAEKEAELEKARELLKDALPFIESRGGLPGISRAIRLYLGDKS